VPGEFGRMPRVASIVYIVIGVIVASQHSYYAHLASLSQVLSAVVATALWPLVLLNANLHLSLANL
jgi:ABC-type anion transport system duplicated permease subunit